MKLGNTLQNYHILLLLFFFTFSSSSWMMQLVDAQQTNYTDPATGLVFPMIYNDTNLWFVGQLGDYGPNVTRFVVVLVRNDTVPPQYANVSLSLQGPFSTSAVLGFYNSTDEGNVKMILMVQFATMISVQYGCALTFSLVMKYMPNRVSTDHPFYNSVCQGVRTDGNPKGMPRNFYFLQNQTITLTYTEVSRTLTNPTTNVTSIVVIPNVYFNLGSRTLYSGSISRDSFSDFVNSIYDNVLHMPVDF